ncbi:MAG: 16S rRNA (guanine(527)-N(7))-methyltransferase RsmG [Sulfuricellaceae bacterium]|nr:16S rRNA (guanine(527)-N(7))-methyltransferase RsmG [Sulfuricellaceae bacterium]
MSLLQQLEQGVAELDLDLPNSAEIKLLAYLDLIVKWNRVYNLTAIRDRQKMLYQHILDCLAVLPHLGTPSSLLDVGSGAGLPGIPLAIASPETQVSLLESNHKRTTFLTQTKIELGFDNVNIVCGRAEDFNPAKGYDVVISRAFSDLTEFVRLAIRHCAPDGRLVAMKGLFPDEEIKNLPMGVNVEKSIPIQVPGFDAERHLIFIKAAL